MSCSSSSRIRYIALDRIPSGRAIRALDSLGVCYRANVLLGYKHLLFQRMMHEIKKPSSHLCCEEKEQLQISTGDARIVGSNVFSLVLCLAPTSSHL
mmetsp:Transcript_1350/g.2993  ORF Transcript_1350/g.2993 Transcript_1350/m.2993 type:complete len:97 (+) Transcript_1350:659-949(+)